MSAFEQNLEKIYAEDKETILLGEFNINLLDSTSSNTRNWLQVTDSVNLTQLVDVPTRVTPNSSTLIDHAFSNRAQNIVDVFVPCYAISDHFPVCLTRKIAKSNKTGDHKTITYRSMKHFEENQFLADLGAQPWSVLDMYDDPNDAFDFFNQTFESTFDLHAPERTKRVKHFLQPIWFNENISEASKKRDYFKKINDIENYKLWRNRAKSLIEESKQMFYSKEINDNRKNSKASLEKLT